MADLDIPIFKKSYELYKEFYKLRLTVPKQDRYVLWQKCESTLITVLEGILLASQQSKIEKLPTLEKTSVKLNFLKVCVRLMKDVKAINPKFNKEMQRLVKYQAYDKHNKKKGFQAFNRF